MIITSEGKDSVVAHFVEDLVLEGTLEARGKKAMLEKVRRAPALIKVESVVQAEPLGLGHVGEQQAEVGRVGRAPGTAVADARAGQPQRFRDVARRLRIARRVAVVATADLGEVLAAGDHHAHRQRPRPIAHSPCPSSGGNDGRRDRR